MTAPHAVFFNPPMAASFADTIRAKLHAAFLPVRLEVEDESARHAGHAGSRRNPDGTLAETHFRIRIVSNTFENMSRLERQRRVYAVLANELRSGVHALSLTTLTEHEAKFG